MNPLKDGIDSLKRIHEDTENRLERLTSDLLPWITKYAEFHDSYMESRVGKRADRHRFWARLDIYNSVSVARLAWHSSSIDLDSSDDKGIWIRLVDRDDDETSGFLLPYAFIYDNAAFEAARIAEWDEKHGLVAAKAEDDARLARWRQYEELKREFDGK